jgi:glycosyltransferase involved in cell wall biosynthesis
MDMKICSANLYYSVTSETETPGAFLERMPLLKDVPAALAAAGHQVDVVQLFAKEASFSVAGVNYHFISPTALERGWARIASRIEGRTWTRHAPSAVALRRVLGLRPDVVHFHRLTQSVPLYLLQALRGVDGPAIVAQFHGGRLTNNWLTRKFQARGLGHVQRAFFANQGAAAPFLREGLLRPEQVLEVPDRSSRLSMKSRPEARLETGMQGAPVFLWYGGLTSERDPMTAVLGFQKLLGTWPKAQLYVYYCSEELLAQLRAYVFADPELARHIQFRSPAYGLDQEAIFNSADFLLQSDRQADNGHALLEAMACGVIPVVSDTPLFRKMVDNGRCGFLFPPGDPDALAKQLLAFSPAKIAGRAALVHDWFEAAYSYEALAGLFLDIYTEAIAERLAQKQMQGAVAEGTGG